MAIFWTKLHGFTSPEITEITKKISSFMWHYTDDDNGDIYTFEADLTEPEAVYLLRRAIPHENTTVVPGRRWRSPLDLNKDHSRWLNPNGERNNHNIELIEGLRISMSKDTES